MSKDASLKKIVVTGGAGYIGSCACHALKKQGFEVVVLDNFSSSERPTQVNHPIHEVDLSCLEDTQKIWKQLGKVHAVIHFAAKALVHESWQNPEDYFRNNLLSTINTAQCALDSGTRSFIHSSSCAVYGPPEKCPITEQTPFHPISPYGESKLINEQILNQLHCVRGLKIVNLRYFNPSGSMDEGRLGENHKPETHLVPNVIKAALTDTPVSIFGNDYDTPDGTCIRDFIHIQDLIDAHLQCLNLLESPDFPGSLALNVGAGRGCSIREVIQCTEKVVGSRLQVSEQARRPGDPPRLEADISQARKLLKWAPQKSLEDIIRSHLEWAQTQLTKSPKA